MNQKPGKSGHKNQSRKIDFNHYIRLILEKRWYILGVTIFVTILWYFIYPVILDTKKQYDFSAIIRFDDPRVSQSASGVDDRYTQMEMESKVRVIKTTPFLTEVIDSLRLNIVLLSPDISREDVFASIRLDKKNLKEGKYKLLNTKNDIQVLYTNEKEDKEDFLLRNLKQTSADYIRFNVQGISAVIHSNIFDDYDEIEFACLPTRYILEGLRNKITLALNPRQTLLTITYQLNDPILGMKITNTVAHLFLTQSLDFKRLRTTTAMEALEEQLQASKKQLEEVEEELKTFHEENQKIYLTGNLVEYNRAMTTNEDNEVERDHIYTNLQRINQLIEEKNSSTGFNDSMLVYQEILTFLEEENIGGITALNQQYASLMGERTSLIEQNYSEYSPRMNDLKQSIRSMQKTVDERIEQYLNLREERAQELSSRIRRFERRMQQSPQKELQLIKLQRERDAKSQVYSNVLLRYNEIKTAHASITPDAYLLESAQLPIIQPNIVDSIIEFIKFMIGPILGLTFALALFIGNDFLWHRARSVDDMEEVLSLPVLATIPLLKSEEKTDNVLENTKRMDPLLVTIDYTPSMAGDAFRNLRTRLILDRDEDEKQNLVVTSLMPNEGKSLVASNLAITFAQLKKQTLLIDADVRRGVIHNSFLCNKKPGLTDMLTRTKDMNMEHINPFIQKTTVPHLSIMTSGTSVPNPTEILISQKIEELVSFLNNKFQYIIIDTPPIEFIHDAFVINKFIKNMLIVTRYGKTNINRLNKKLNEFSELKETVKGIVLNASVGLLEKKYDNYSYYRY